MAKQAAHSTARDTSWPVKMAQYVPPPSAEALASALPFFKKRRRSHLPGTWLSSKSTATVTLSSASRSGLGPSIALILQGHVHEEHLLSTLAFTWPRFRDENGHTSSPGRAILASYKKICTEEVLLCVRSTFLSWKSHITGCHAVMDTVSYKLTFCFQKHKFAMQFETVLQAEWFFKTVKQLIAAHGGISKDIQTDENEQMEYAIPISRVENLDSYSSQMNTAVATGQIGSLRGKRVKSSTLSADVPLSELSASAGVQSLPLVLPPRFPSLDLQNHPFRVCTNGCDQQKGENPTISGEGPLNEQNLEDKIKAYLLDPEFQRFVDKVETVWHAMEANLATEISSVHS